MEAQGTSTRAVQSCSSPFATSGLKKARSDMDLVRCFGKHWDYLYCRSTLPRRYSSAWNHWLYYSSDSSGRRRCHPPLSCTEPHQCIVWSRWLVNPLCAGKYRRGWNQSRTNDTEANRFGSVLCPLSSFSVWCLEHHVLCFPNSLKLLGIRYGLGRHILMLDASATIPFGKVRYWATASRFLLAYSSFRSSSPLPSFSMSPLRLLSCQSCFSTTRSFPFARLW